ncbi:hypothetical protein [Sphingobium sp. B2]|uniref:hypothetical protein n=1 Tax=Sphingobium sp. B2 TaxID=2583228 RepID=UPI0011A50063|nr:hypothetical protein [Sphingobium sp. B2]
MTDNASFDPLSSLVHNWTTMALAPQKLWQSINGGWSFGNIIVNENNSSAPQTEQAIVAQQSYGRQIGKLLDAVDTLARRQPDWSDTEPLKAAIDLKIRVDGVKLAMAQRRIDQLRGDLELLRAAGPADQYDASVAALRKLLAELPETGD